MSKTHIILLIKLNIAKDEFMISFDVVSFFPNIRIPEMLNS